MHILSSDQELLLKNERRSLNDLQLALAGFGAKAEDLASLSDSLRQLDDLFLLVVVGEFNSGKSAFINALMGQQLLKEGVTPTTTQINLLRYGSEQERIYENENQFTMTFPADLLAEISIVDTPGTNAIIRAHEAITSQFIPRADLVLFITSADRPFTESERLFLETISDWGKKIVIVINKIDILQNPEELQQIVSFVRDHSKSLLGLSPEIFPVSARQALRAKQGEPVLWEPSQFEILEDYIHNTLDEGQRLRLKFLNPLGVGLHHSNLYLDIIQSRLDLLTDDLGVLADVDTQLAVYKDDMQRDFIYRMADIENILYEMEQRGDEFFEETFRLARVFDLLNKDRIQRGFQQHVIVDVPQRVEQKVNELIDWLVESNFRQWQAVNEHLADRRRQYKERILGDTIGSFNFDRERIIEGMGHDAQRVVDAYDKAAEARAIADDAQMAVTTSAAIEMSALGLGALITVLATTMAADVTGILLASLVAALGLFVIPARRRKAKAELHQKIAELREQLVSSLGGQFEKEIERSLQHIQETIAPYTRFVRGERARLTEHQTLLDKNKTELIRLKLAIENIQ